MYTTILNQKIQFEKESVADLDKQLQQIDEKLKLIEQRLKNEK